MDGEYARAFQGYGIDVDRLGPSATAALIRGRPIWIRLAAALDDWATVRRRAGEEGGRGAAAGTPTGPDWGYLVEVAQAADPDPWRARLREAIRRRDSETLKMLAEDTNVESQSAFNLLRLGRALDGEGRHAEAEHVLQRAVRRHPGDLWLNLDLARILFGVEHSRALIEQMTILQARQQMMKTIPTLTGTSLATIFSQMETARTRSQEDLKRWGEVVRFATVAVALRSDKALVHNLLGMALQGYGDHEEAIAEFKEAIRIEPDSADAHTLLGGALAKKGKLDEAIAEYREAIRLKPDDALYHYNLGFPLAMKGKLDEAIAECREAIRLKPDGASYHSMLGLALKMKGKLDEAIAEYREAIRLKPDDASYHNGLGLVLQAKGKLDEAIAEYREAIRLKPDDALYHNGLGSVLQAKGKLDEAIAEYREAIRLKPDEAMYHDGLGFVLQAKGKLDEAIAEYREAIRLKPDFPLAHANLGLVLQAKGKLDEAIAEFREAIRLKPDEAMYHNGLGFVLQAKGKHDEAIAECREAIRLKPDFPLAHANLGFVLERKGKHDEAIAECREAIRLKPDDAFAHAGLGRALEATGQLDEAVAAFRKAIGLRPTDGQLWYDYALVQLAQGDSKGYRKACEELLERLGQTDDPVTANCVAWTLSIAPDATTNLDRPVQLAEKAVASDPKNFAYLRTLGAALYRVGQFDVAVKRLNEATENQSPEGTIYMAYKWLFLAMAHHRLGHAGEARKWLDKAVGRIDQLTKENLGKSDVGIWRTWEIRLELQLLRREAEVLVQAESR